MAKRKPLTKGTELGSFIVVDVLSSGGSSLTYTARNKDTGLYAVIKEYYPYQAAEKGIIYRADNGIDLLPAPGHAAKAKAIFDAPFTYELAASRDVCLTEDNNDPRFFPAQPLAYSPQNKNTLNEYIVIECCAGECLYDVEPYGHTPEERICDCINICLRIAEVTKALHNEKRRLHLDINPRNVFLPISAQGDPAYFGNHPAILIDFGSSVRIDRNDSPIVDEGFSFSADPNFAANEILDLLISDTVASEQFVQYQADYAREKISKQADIYSIYRIFEWLLAGKINPENLQSSDVRNGPDFRQLPDPIQNYIMSFVEDYPFPFSDINALITFFNGLINMIQSRGICKEIIRVRSKQKLDHLKSVTDDYDAEFEPKLVFVDTD